MRVFLTALLTLVAAAAALSPATAGASNVYPTNADIRKELKASCDFTYDFLTKAKPREIVQACNRYYKCLVRHLGYKKIRVMYTSLKRGDDPYKHKPFNTACLQTHLPR
jgi:hypothetical protein